MDSCESDGVGLIVNSCSKTMESAEEDGVSNQYLDLDKTTGELPEMGSSSKSSEREVSAIKKKSLFNCLVCGKKFNQNAGRYNHMKKIHNIFRGDKTNIRCLEKGCSYRCSYKEKLQLHLVEEHGLSMDIRVKTFNNYSEFLRWKEELEKQEKTRFVKKSGSRSRERGVRVVYFYCSRSTTKSAPHCTASITCLELSSGRVEVKVCATHYGHDTDLQQLRLTQADKIQIVEQLIKGVPRDVVLDSIRSSASSEVDRIHLITIKDVKNIEKAFRINAKASSETASNIVCNINKWVSLMSKSEHSPVVHFEEQGSSDLINYDFTLVIMTLGQIEMAKKYGQSKIFYIPTYATSDNKYFVYGLKAKNTHEINIVTLIVIDGCNEALPISFMISTNISKDKFKLFFKCVKQKVPEIDAKVILTDDDDDIFEAWNNVFTTDGQNPCHLWSNRFVDKDWRDNLIVIPNESIQESIYEKLYSYLESTEENEISSSLKEYVANELVTNPLTVQFGNNFALKYLGSEQFWAGCYGKRIVPIHAQLNMERLSNEIEEVVDRKQFDKRFIVRTVQDLLKLISDNQCQRQAKIQKQIQELPNHHILGSRIHPEAISKLTTTTWRVNSSKDPENIFSIVTKQEEKCCATELCQFTCTKCNSCAHEFKCSCRYYAFDKTMCKHIHAVVSTFFDQIHVMAAAAEEAEDNFESAERELVQLKNDCFWSRRRKRKLEPSAELQRDLSVEEENFIPILDEIIHNRKAKELKRKRGRPRKNVTLDEETSEKDSPNEESEKSHRSKVNILRKNVKISPCKSKPLSTPRSNP